MFTHQLKSRIALQTSANDIISTFFAYRYSSDSVFFSLRFYMPKTLTQALIWIVSVRKIFLSNIFFSCSVQCIIMFTFFKETKKKARIRHAEEIISLIKFTTSLNIFALSVWENERKKCDSLYYFCLCLVNLKLFDFKRNQTSV